MEHVKRFLNQRNILVLLLVLSTVSLASDVYLYYGIVKPLKEQEGEPETGAGWRQGIQGGMGWIQFSLSKGLILAPETKFNISVSAMLWEPYIGSKTYEFYFKFYERPLHGQYSALIVEKNVTVYKDKNEMWIDPHSGNLTITGPATPGIYIYKVCFGTLPAYLLTSWNYTMEFPIMIYYPYYPTG